MGLRVLARSSQCVPRTGDRSRPCWQCRGARPRWPRRRARTGPGWHERNTPVVATPGRLHGLDGTGLAHVFAQALIGRRDRVQALELVLADHPDADAVFEAIFAQDPTTRHAATELLPGLVRLADVEPEHVTWLWPGRIPLAKITLLDGDPGLGKSSLTLDLAARTSVGASMPDGSPGVAGGVVILSAEDGVADTIRPRVEAAGGDLSRIAVLRTVGVGEDERLPAIPDDLPEVEVAIAEVGATLLIVDPLAAFLGADVNSHRDQDVRRALAPFAALAERTKVAVTVVRHLNKATGASAIYRGGGSIGIAGAARSVLLVAKDPADPERRILAPVKSNLGRPSAALAYTMEEASNGAVKVAWQGESDLSADRLLASRAMVRATASQSMRLASFSSRSSPTVRVRRRKCLRQLLKPTSRPQRFAAHAKRWESSPNPSTRTVSEACRPGGGGFPRL